MYRWTNDYFKVLEKNLDPFFENILAVSMCKKEISDMRCSFHMQGRFNRPSRGDGIFRKVVNCGAIN